LTPLWDVDGELRLLVMCACMERDLVTNDHVCVRVEGLDWHAIYRSQEERVRAVERYHDNEDRVIKPERIILPE
jgi:hypothetical protein